MKFRLISFIYSIVTILILLTVLMAHAEDGYDLWLRYIKIDDPVMLVHYQRTIAEIVVPGDQETMSIIRNELRSALSNLLDKEIRVSDNITTSGTLVVGTPSSFPLISRCLRKHELDNLGKDGYLIRSINMENHPVMLIASNSEVGALYGTFHFLRLVQTHQSLTNLNISEKPKIERRLLNHWDNIFPTKFGTVERGYAGESLWKWTELPDKIDPRYRDYACANASIGINGAVLNNVNSEPHILKTEYLVKLAALADIFRPYGIRIYITANYAAPLEPSDKPFKFKKWGGIGHLKNADPINPEVIQWWKDKTEEIYRYIPDFGGFLVKANSEGMPGPQDYGRTHADGANMLAEALAPHGGIVMWRAFVYDTTVDPDRTKRSYKEFVPLDGKFRPNVFVQSKNGPLDFQPREPCHPLFGAMPNTPLIIELQITQEYLGESTHLVYLAPMWKESLEFDTHARGEGSTVARIIDGSIHNYPMTGIAGVANTGSIRNWCGHPFAQANWYAYGRLSWDHTLTSETIAYEWIRMTWSSDPRVVDTIREMMMGSWEACVNYMSPLGLTYTVSANHYDPDPASRNHKFWIADSEGLGYDRTTGESDAVSQYYPPVRDLFNDLNSTPEKYLCYFHKVRWDHPMETGRTFREELYHLYDIGVAYVRNMQIQWKTLRGLIDEERYTYVSVKLDEQVSHAEIWRDTCVDFFGSFYHQKTEIR